MIINTISNSGSSSPFANFKPARLPVNPGGTYTPTFMYLDSSDNYIYMFYSSFSGGIGVYRTSDFQTYTKIVSDAQPSIFRVSSDDTLMFYGSGTNIYVSRDGGSNFTQVTNNTGMNIGNGGIANGNILFTLYTSQTNAYIYVLKSDNTLYGTSAQCYMTSRVYFANSHYWFVGYVGNDSQYIFCSKNTTLETSYPFNTLLVCDSSSVFLLAGIYVNEPYGFVNNSSSLFKFTATSSAITRVYFRAYSSLLWATNGESIRMTSEGVIFSVKSVTGGWVSWCLDITDTQVIGPAYSFSYSSGTPFIFKNTPYLLLEYDVYTVDPATATTIHGVNL